jgi:deazaflavin-dependent oxidoreductase (nitroreductase family)
MANALEDQLSRVHEITITTTGRKSGRTISLPIWFVWEDGTLYLLPVKGSDTQWCRNMFHNPAIRIKAGNAEGEFTANAVTEAAQVKSVVEKFRAKYGTADVRKYYSKFDVAVIVRDENAR